MCVCGKTFTLFIFISISLIFIRSSFLHTHESIIHKICIHVQQYLNKLCHLRQSIHLQKKVKEKIASRRRTKPSVFVSNSPRVVPLQSFEVHTQDSNTDQINMSLYSGKVCDYMRTDGTLWFNIWALITWTLVMIFF